MHIQWCNAIFRGGALSLVLQVSFSTNRSPKTLVCQIPKMWGMGQSLLEMESRLVVVCLVADDTRTQPLTVGKKRRSIGQQHTQIV
jgi:hypothetical protein